MVLAVLVTVVAGCGRDGGLPRLAADGTPSFGVVRVADPHGVSLVDADEGRVRTWIRDGVRSRDWVFTARLTALGTQLAAVSPLGELGWHRDYDGDLVVRTVSSDGSRVALLPHGSATVDPYHPAGRLRTTLTVVSTDDGARRGYDLPGNFEPEAFSTSGSSLFVIEYVPADAPERYRVRKLDLGSGEIGPVFSLDGHLQESMRGTARVHALSADGARLYTLYTTDSAAFVHVVDLDEEWAHCVDLPASIGHSPEEHLAIAADPDGDGVAVVDTLAGVAVIDTVTLTTTRTMPITMADGEAGQAQAVVDRDGRLVAARGHDVVVLGRSLGTIARWRTAAPVLGLHLDPSRDAVWLLGLEALYLRDTLSGTALDATTLPSEMPDLELPVANATLPIQCAC